MNPSEYLHKLKQTPENIEFNDLMKVIETHYQFTPTSFQNGPLKNSDSENQGSCKIFSFGKEHALSKSQTLACFGAFYRDDVLHNPNGTDHQNIRQFMQTGWEGVAINGDALIE